MKNKALISLSFLVLLGVSACSTSNQKPQKASKEDPTKLSNASSSSIRATGNVNPQQWQSHTANPSEHDEQKRLAYNYAWQKKQQQNRNNNSSNQSAAQARRQWQQQQAKLLNQERNRSAQQFRLRKNRQFVQEQKSLAKEYAAQQMRRQAQQRAAKQNHGRTQQYTAQQTKARQYAAQQMQRQAQQRAAQQMQRQAQQSAAQQYAARQMRLQNRQYYANQLQLQNRQHAANQIPQQAQQHARNQQRAQPQLQHQQSQQSQYLAMLQRNPNTLPRTAPQSNIASISPSELRTIGDKIFRNESGGEIDKLVHWNVGENFASMGIGHFTWYPAGRRKRFGNTFPGMLDHLQANGVQLPVWVQKAKHTGAPWRTKGELKHAKNSPQLRQFQNLLYETRHLQASYIFERAKRAVPRLVKATPPHLRAHVAQNLNAVANTRGGWYALIDYVNFKGEGLNRRGGYKGQNWGLLQVLENMRPSQPGQMALNNFADSAIQTLERRIRNSNPSRGEKRWMRGWAVRCNTYRQPFVI